MRENVLFNVFLICIQFVYVRLFRPDRKKLNDPPKDDDKDFPEIVRKLWMNRGDAYLMSPMH